MSKMFVHYKGTVAEFKAAQLESTYVNHIVFIKGGESGTGEAVYTHGSYFANVKEALASLQTRVDGLKYFSKVSDGTTTASVASADGTITIKGEDPTVTTVIDTTGIKIGLSDAFKKSVNEDLPADIAAAKKAGEDAAAAVDDKLGAKDAVAASGSEATAFGRIKNLETIVAGLTGSEGGEVESVDAKITNAINKLDVSALEGDFVASVSQVDGKIEATMGTFNFDEKGAAAAAQAAAAADAQTKADAAQAAAIADAAGKYQIKGDYEAAGAAAAVQGNLDTEVLRAKAAEEANANAIAAEKARMDAFMLDADVQETAVDTLKEIQAYITSDGAAAQEMLTAIAAAQGAADAAQGEVDALEEVVAGVKSTADAAATKAALEAEISRAGAAEKANADAIDAIEADYLKAADKTELSNAISAETQRATGIEGGLETRLAAVEADYLKAEDKTELQNNINAKVAQSDYDAKIAALEAKDAELEGFWAWEEL